MHDRGKSDGPVVPTKLPNNTGRPVAEAVEERGLAKGNTASKTRPGLRAGQGVSSALDRVRRAAQKDKEARFTALLHHVDVDRLRAAYEALSRDAAAGVDGVTWRAYGQWLGSVVRGHYAYYAVPGNSDSINAFYNEATRLWYRSLRRRSQRTRLKWTRMRRISARWLPPPRRMHPFPNARFDARTQGRSPVR
jgi:hypothetical protein